MLLRIAIANDPILSNNSTLNVYLQEIDILLRKSYRRDSFASKIVICFEGLPLSGKSSCAIALTSRTHGAHIEFPDKLNNIRQILSSQPTAILSAFEHSVNYFMADAILTSPESIVFTSDYYHSTMASCTCAMLLKEEDLNTLPCSAFEWPLDLPMPTLVVFLAVSTDVRKKRLPKASRKSHSSLTSRSVDRLLAQDAFKQVRFLSHFFLHFLYSTLLAYLTRIFFHISLCNYCIFLQTNVCVFPCVFS